MIDIKIFHGLKEETILNLELKFKEKKYAPEEIVCREGDPAKEMYFIKEGTVDIIVKGTKITELKTGESFGEMSLIDMMTRSATIKASSETILLSLYTKDFYELYKKDAKEYTIVILNIARELSRRLREVDSKLVNKNTVY